MLIVVLCGPTGQHLEYVVEGKKIGIIACSLNPAFKGLCYSEYKTNHLLNKLPTIQAVQY